jgi:arginase
VSIIGGSGTPQHHWDLLVSPWHLNEHIEQFPMPAGAIALAGPSDPAATELGKLTGRLSDAADAVSQAGRPLLLAGDCLTSLGGQRISRGARQRRRH